MEQLVPKLGDCVLHQSKVYHGKVIGYGRRLTQEGVQVTLKVSLIGRLTSSQTIVIEDLASHWTQISRKPF